MTAEQLTASAVEELNTARAYGTPDERAGYHVERAEVWARLAQAAAALEAAAIADPDDAPTPDWAEQR